MVLTTPFEHMHVLALEGLISFPPNDTIRCHHGPGLSISQLWEFIIYGEFNTRQYILVHD